MFNELIEKLLVLQSKLESEKQTRIENAVTEINKEFEENAVKIQKALDEFGYVKPQEKTNEIVDNNEVVEENLI